MPPVTKLELTSGHYQISVTELFVGLAIFILQKREPILTLGLIRNGVVSAE